MTFVFSRHVPHLWQGVQEEDVYCLSHQGHSRRSQRTRMPSLSRNVFQTVQREGECELWLQRLQLFPNRKCITCVLFRTNQFLYRYTWPLLIPHRKCTPVNCAAGHSPTCLIWTFIKRNIREWKIWSAPFATELLVRNVIWQCIWRRLTR